MNPYLIALIIISLFLVIISLYNNYCNKIAKDHSVYLRNIDSLNKQYKFYDIDKSFSHVENYDNENVFNDISCDDVLIYHLQSISKEIKPFIEKIHFNKEKYNEYLLAFNKLDGKGVYDIPVVKFFKSSVDKRVLELARKNTIAAPVRKVEIKITLILYRVNGALVTRKSCYYDESQIINYIKRIENKSGSFFNDRGIWDSICKVERGKVSNKLRFRIYERDGYRCKICGKSDENENLEIDHIIPISKGGKSTPDNLQTLCHGCNYNKGNRL